MIPDGFTVVAGSLGDQGGAAARTLKQHGRHVRALSPNRWSETAQGLIASGVEVLNDDLETPEVVVRDLAGAAHVFAAFTPFDDGGVRAEFRRARNLAWASVRAGVEHLIASSVGDPERDGDTEPGDLWGVERLLRQFDLPLTLVRPALFMESVLGPALHRDDDGLLTLRAPLHEDAAVPWIAVGDLATLVRLAFDRPGIFGPGPVHLAAEQLCFAEARALISEALGEEVRYEQVALGAVQERHSRGMYRWLQSSAPPAPDAERLRALHPGLLTFREWLAGGPLERAEVLPPATAAA